MSDESTIPRFLHWLERNELTVPMFGYVHAELVKKGPNMKRGSILDASLIATPSSTKNQDMKRDPEMTQTKKGIQ